MQQPELTPRQLRRRKIVVLPTILVVVPGAWAAIGTLVPTGCSIPQLLVGGPCTGLAAEVGSFLQGFAALGVGVLVIMPVKALMRRIETREDRTRS